MLVLSRFEGEKIVIDLTPILGGREIEGGPLITLDVIEIRSRYSRKVRIGIEAPKEVPVHREEVFLEILREGRRP